MSKAIYLLLALFFATTTLSATNSHGPWETKNPETKNQKPRNADAAVNIMTKAWLFVLTKNPVTKTPFISNGLEQLNQAMQTTLRLSSEKLEAIRQINRAFWEERQAILEEPGRVARHTALLSAWDRWARNLQTLLDKYQYKAFLEWQYAVSPLSERPY